MPEIPKIPQVPGIPIEPPIDVCRLLTSEEVTAVIGANNGGRLDPGIGAGSCSWRNDETYSSITVRIGRAGTAPSDRLPEPSDYGPTEPGPVGIRFAPGNVAEFAVDGRACDLQVVTDVTTDADRPTAVQMIGSGTGCRHHVTSPAIPPGPSRRRSSISSADEPTGPPAFTLQWTARRADHAAGAQPLSVARRRVTAGPAPQERGPLVDTIDPGGYTARRVRGRIR